MFEQYHLGSTPGAIRYISQTEQRDSKRKNAQNRSRSMEILDGMGEHHARLLIIHVSRSFPCERQGTRLVLPGEAA